MSGLLRLPDFEYNPQLEDYSLPELVAALVRRTSDDKADFGVLAEWSSLLAIELERRGDIHENRLSRQRLRDIFSLFTAFPSAERPSFQGITVVELGCGGLNPLSQLLVFVMLGAKRAIGVDFDAIHDERCAALALSRTAAWMLTDPYSIVGGYAPRHSEMIKNLGGIDLPALAKGDLVEGLRNGPLRFSQKSIYELDMEPGFADLVISNSFLEHVPEVERAVECISRITKSGGYTAHGVDGFDHQHYFDGRHPLDFLKVESDENLVGGCNRVRPLQFLPIFERSGFDVLRVRRWPHSMVDLGTIDLTQLSSRFRDLPREILEVARAEIYCRKCVTGT